MSPTPAPTLPEVFARRWERTHDVLDCIRAVLDAHAEAQRRPAIRAIGRGQVMDEARQIAKRIAADAGLVLAHLTGRSRVGAVSRVRQDAMWAIRDRFGEMAQHTEVGHLFGGRDHSTVITAIRAADARILRNPEHADRLRALAKLNGLAVVPRTDGEDQRAA